jgi:hypothetical protein
VYVNVSWFQSSMSRLRHVNHLPADPASRRLNASRPPIINAGTVGVPRIGEHRVPDLGLRTDAGASRVEVRPSSLSSCTFSTKLTDELCPSGGRPPTCTSCVGSPPASDRPATADGPVIGAAARTAASFPGDHTSGVQVRSLNLRHGVHPPSTTTSTPTTTVTAPVRGEETG